MKQMSILLGGLVLAVAAAPARANVVYSQTTTPSSFFSGYISQSAGTSGYGQVYEDFSTPTGGTFSQVSWRGLETNSAAIINSFTITLYSDDFTLGNPGADGTVLYSTTITGNNNQVNLGTINGFEGYDFSANIDPFVALANTTYWISIVADAPGTDFYWASSTGGNGSFLSRDAGNGLSNLSLGENTLGLAFTLSNPNATPEPSAFVLTGTGLLGGLGMMRRRLIKR